MPEQEKDMWDEQYNHIKNKKGKYDESVHCPMVLRVISQTGRKSAFCKEAMISDVSFWRWTRKYKTFNECYRIALMAAIENWEESGEQGKWNPDFNCKVWEMQGANWFSISKTAKIRIDTADEATPYEQYKQIMQQAALGEFNSSELKQIMEVVNIGLRAHNEIELQKQIDEIKNNLSKANQNYEHNIIPIETTQKTN